MSDSFSEVSREGFLGRIGNAIKGVIFGAILFLISFAVLWWNEGRAVHMQQMLEEGKGAVVSINSPDPTPATEGKLVHFTGNTVGGKLTDDLFGLSQDAIHFERVVEMYQWKETEKKETKKDAVGGGETTKTTYTYDKVWSPSLIDSSKFNPKDPKNHDNPADMRINGQTLTALEVKVGGFKLDKVFVNQINTYTPVALTAENIAKLPDEFRSDAALSDGKCYVSGQKSVTPDPASPRIGDLKISERVALPGQVSVIGRQTAGLLDAYPTKVQGDKPLAFLYPGAKSAVEIFNTEASKSATLTWILRVVGFALMWIGLMLVLNPLKVMADVIGFVGDLVGMGLGLVTLVVAFSLSLLTIAISWLAFRPLIGGALLAVAVLGLVAVLMKSRGRRAARLTAPAA